MVVTAGVARNDGGGGVRETEEITNAECKAGHSSNPDRGFPLLTVRLRILDLALVLLGALNRLNRWPLIRPTWRGPGPNAMRDIIVKVSVISYSGNRR